MTKMMRTQKQIHRFLRAFLADTTAWSTSLCPASMVVSTLLAVASIVWICSSCLRARENTMTKSATMSALQLKGTCTHRSTSMAMSLNSSCSSCMVAAIRLMSSWRSCTSRYAVRASAYLVDCVRALAKTCEPWSLSMAYLISSCVASGLTEIDRHQRTVLRLLTFGSRSQLTDFVLPLHALTVLFPAIALYLPVFLDEGHEPARAFESDSAATLERVTAETHFCFNAATCILLAFFSPSCPGTRGILSTSSDRFLMRSLMLLVRRDVSCVKPSRSR